MKKNSKQNKPENSNLEDPPLGKRIKVIIGDEEREAEYRIFASGKTGYGLYGIIKIEGYPYRLSMNIIAF